MQFTIEGEGVAVLGNIGTSPMTQPHIPATPCMTPAAMQMSH